MERIELSIKEIGEIDGRRVMCIEETGCTKCVFVKTETCKKVLCSSWARKDGKYVNYIDAQYDPIANLREDIYSNEFEK